MRRFVIAAMFTGIYAPIVAAVALAFVSPEPLTGPAVSQRHSASAGSHSAFTHSIHAARVAPKQIHAPLHNVAPHAAPLHAHHG